MKKNNVTEIENVGGGISLRKLTLKSKWDFTPKHQGWTIEEVLKHNPKSLFWAYTHLEKISFVDEILDILDEKFPNFHRIQKPGIDHDQYNDYQTKANPYADKTPDELLTIIRAKKLSGQMVPKLLYREYDKARGRKISSLSDKNVISKAKLARVNQGKIEEQKMKKYIFTENQIKTIINSQLSEQSNHFSNPPMVKGTLNTVQIDGGGYLGNPSDLVKIARSGRFKVLHIVGEARLNGKWFQPETVQKQTVIVTTQTVIEMREGCHLLMSGAGQDEVDVWAADGKLYFGLGW
jgi:hypothetical protein